MSPFEVIAGEQIASGCEREIIRASRSSGVPVGILYAVGLTESGRGGRLQPFAMNVDGKSAFFNRRHEAVSHFRSVKANGARFVDIGCMQINYRFHSVHFANVEDMFDPRKNVEYAAKFLRDLRNREGSWVMAAARYHAGPRNHAAHHRYVCAVLQRLVETGFGAWTAEARQLCAHAPT